MSQLGVQVLSSAPNLKLKRIKREVIFLSNINRQDRETKLNYFDRLIKNRKNYDLDKNEVYELITGKQVSSDHARKCLGFADYIINEIKNDLVISSDTKDDEIKEQLNKKSAVEISSDGTHKSEKLLQMSQEQSKDVNFILESHGYPSDSWELTSSRSSVWNINSKINGIQTLYSSKITVKPRKDFVWTEEKAKKVFDSLCINNINKNTIKQLQFEENGNTLVVPIADFHLGLLSDKYSSGNEYNMEIAEELYYYTLNDVMSRVSNRKFEKVLFIVGNDFVNADNLSGTTTKGTPQDNSNSWYKIVLKATELISNGIDILSTIAPVDVQYVMSNHDLHTMWGIMQTIKAYYRKEDDITIYDSPLPRKYYRIGKTLLALSHDIKIKDALKIVTTEAKSEWGNSESVICMLAHLHQAMVYEKQGYLEVLRLPTISGWSRWSNTAGYVQTEKKNQSFIINDELGIKDQINTIIKNK